ncbi:tripartite tricarboxylate transporter TctB family protein [Pelagibacterium sp. H642]|uniref:tripartite tricarboxylate transporter TctB family protein n=1 Tax=Pelagibacterium sp. H642 TaxID=1881069 RepID=UPI00281634C4|nr:tripartite tricarboxylate transporter TctB family protein [Pelagibacterium sp. H642]WMT89376.1 tripartite tricarboxylate transporter TctB family protein [Pelagibacterium sp. H642]
MATETARHTRTWRIGRAAAGALGLIFSLVYLFEGKNLDLGRMGAPGPGIFPLIVGVILALVSVGVIADALLTRRAGSAGFPKGENLKRLAVIFGAFLIYVGVINVVGFLAATVSLVTFYTRMVGHISWLKAVICGIGVTAVVWAAFVLILGVRLPTAMWG